MFNFYVITVLGIALYFANKQDRLSEQKRHEEINVIQQKRAEQRHREEIARRLATKMYFKKNSTQLNSGYRGYSQNPYLYTSGSWYKGWQNH